MNSLYKYSRFNLIIEETSDQVLLYNTYSLNYMYINKPDFRDIFEQSSIDLGDVPEYLSNQGFIVPVDLDEIQRIKDDAYEQSSKVENMFLSIYTTLACNYRCVYCFEKEKLCNSEHMTIETADEIIDFVLRMRKKYNIDKSLHIKWFGGEPLLNMEIIRYITKELRSKNIPVWAKMYTNGRLLTKEIALELKELGVNGDVIIPIDGLSENYARLKGCSEKDFYTVLNNIKDAQEILKIFIHLNTSESNSKDIPELYRLLREDYGIKCRITVNSIEPQNTDSITFDNNIDTEKIIELQNTINKTTGVIRTLSGCEGRHWGYFVIDPKGETYICEHMVGHDEYKTGHISNINSTLNRKGTIWDNNRIIDECSDCPILPICLGGCSTNRHIDNIDCNKELQINDIKNKVKQLSESRQEQTKE